MIGGEMTQDGSRPAGRAGIAPQVLIVMGVSGSGKTTVGKALAARLDWPWLEGDTLHPPANVAKMRGGTPLDDADRRPWLEAVAAHVAAWRDAGSPGIVACSALKRRYRRAIVGDRPGAPPAVRVVYLEGSKALLSERLARHKGHFMPSELLQSQFEALEPPGPDENPLTVSVAGTPEEIVEAILQKLAAEARRAG
jgi:carbohydrate kinase (thermoresistant glucokinase family)